MRRLHVTEYEKYAPDEPGSVRVNHDTHYCSGSSQSLRVTRTEDDRIIAKCYRCGGFGSTGGSLSAVPAIARWKHSHSKVNAKVNTVYLPSDFTNQIVDMPTTIRSMLYTYLITQKLVSDYGLGWSEKVNRFYFPVYRGGELLGYQARYYGDDSTFPKYITRYKEHGDLWKDIKHYGTNYTEGCVIVEDMFSAIRCAEWSNSIALLGSSMGDKCFDHAVNCYDKFLIFLDDDNVKVKNQAIQIRERLTMVGKDATIFTSGGTDPKEFSRGDLQMIIVNNLR